MRQSHWQSASAVLVASLEAEASTRLPWTQSQNGKVSVMSEPTNAAQPTTALATIQQATVQPIVSAKSGNTTGHRYSLCNTPARLLREQGKLSGLKGKALTEHVNKGLESERAMRVALGTAFVHHAIDQGFLPDHGDVRKRSASLKFVKPSEIKSITVDEVLGSANKLGDKAKRDLMEKLQAELAPKPETINVPATSEPAVETENAPAPEPMQPAAQIVAPRKRAKAKKNEAPAAISV
jgi:hypothetical protein